MAGSIIYQSYVEPLAPAVEEPSPVSWMQPQLPPTPHRYYRPSSNVVSGLDPQFLETITQLLWHQPNLPPTPHRRFEGAAEFNFIVLESLFSAAEDITLDKWFVQHHLPTPHKTYWSETTTVYGWEELLLEEEDEGTQREFPLFITVVDGLVQEGGIEKDVLVSADLPDVPASRLPDVSTIAVGTYTLPTLTVDRHGRIVAIANGTISAVALPAGLGLGTVSRALSASVNDFAPGPAGLILLTTGGSNYDFTGLSMGQTDGQEVFIFNDDSLGNVVFKMASSSSASANRLSNGTSLTDITLTPGGRSWWKYTSATTSWRYLGSLS